MPAESVNPWWSGKTSPGSMAAPVNRYPGPALYTVEAGWDPWLPFDGLLAPYGLRALVGPRTMRRDANEGWGMWPDVARLPYEPVNTAAIGLRVIERDYKSRFADMPGLWVPLYEGDPERRVWRRRKWWGRGPIIFAPWGRPRLVHGLLRDRPALLWPGSPSRRGLR